MGTLAWALAWAARGFRVFPLHENTKAAPALGPGWPTYATTDPATIERWWRDPLLGQERNYNIGTVTSDLCVVDLDVGKGEDGVATFQATGGGPHTLTVRSPSGGFHLYYRPAQPVANAQDKGGFGPGVDVRGRNGFVLAPGSSIDGRFYEIVADAPIAPMPDTFWRYLRAPDTERERRDAAPATDLDTPASISAVVNYLRTAPPAIEGQHGDYRTLQTAYRCRDLGVSQDMALSLMLEHFNDRCIPPWDPDELEVKVGNAYLYGENAPGAQAAQVLFAGVQPIDPPAVEIETPAPAGPEFKPFAFGSMLRTAALLPRSWVLKRMLEVGEVTALVAMGGVGKSSLSLHIAALLAIGAPTIFGFENVFAGSPRRSIIYNAEDSLQEMSKRLSAICMEYQIPEDVIIERVSVTSGRDFRLSIATGGQVAHRTEDNDDHIGRLISSALDPSTVFMSIDPISKIHTADPRDNQDMNVVMDILQFIATRAGVGLMVPMHTSRAGADGGDYAGNAHALLGAVAASDSARMVFTLSPPTGDDVLRYGMPEDERYRYLRLDDAKLNRAMRSGQPAWIEKRSARLITGDDIGTFVSIDMSDRVDLVRARMADVLVAEMRREATAKISLSQAALVLQRGDPIYSVLSPAQVRSRLERFLHTPAEADDGTAVRLIVEGSSKFLVLE